VRSPLLVVALVLLFALVLFVPPLLDDDHAVDATPAPPPLSEIALVRLPGGERACLANVVLDPGSAVARFQVGTFRRPGPPLEVSAAGRRYSVRGGYRDNAPLAVTLTRPRAPVRTSLCIANRGRVPVALYASDEVRTRSRVVVTAAGRPVSPDVTLTLDRAQPRSVVDQLEEVVDHTARWRPGVQPWFVWLLLVAVLLGVPGLAALALARAQPGDEGVAADVRDDVPR
jgi:hypothetical protein